MHYDILVIDDEESLLRLFTAVLGNHHYKVATALSGIQALEFLKDNTVSLIFLDLKMPIMSGVDTLREINKITENIIVYIISAFESEFFMELESVRNEGIPFEILRKPIPKNELIELVSTIIPKNNL